jgi:hypothetical protein
MMLYRTPASRVAMVKTVGVVVGSTVRDVRVLTVCTTAAEAAMTSTPFHGQAPCVCLPLRTMSTRSDAAMKPCGRHQTDPGSPGTTCRPKMASTPKRSSTPS